MTLDGSIPEIPACTAELLIQFAESASACGLTLEQVAQYHQKAQECLVQFFPRVASLYDLTATDDEARERWAMWTFNTALLEAVRELCPDLLVAPDGDVRRATELSVLLMSMDGSPAAMDESVRRHRRAAKCAMRGDEDAAADVLHDVVLHVYRRQLKSLARFATLLRQSLRNRATKDGTDPMRAWESLEGAAVKDGARLAERKSVSAFDPSATKPPGRPAKKKAGAPNRQPRQKKERHRALTKSGEPRRKRMTAEDARALDPAVRREVIRLVFRWSEETRKRAAGVLTILRGLSPAHVAVRLRIPDQTAKTWGHRASKFVARFLTPARIFELTGG